MKKVLFALLMAAMFVGCGYEFQKKDSKDELTLIVTKDVGNVVAKGNVEFMGSWVEITTMEGSKLTLHGSSINAIMHDYVLPPPQAQQPPVPPAPKTEGKKPVQKE